jgi:hypothetical protein
MEDRQTLSGAFDGAPVEGEAPENVQVVLAFWSVAPQGPPHERVDAVGADQDVCGDDLAIGHVQPDARFVLLDALNVAVDAEHPGRQCGQHPLVQIRAEQADEAAAVLGQDVVGRQRVRAWEGQYSNGFLRGTFGCAGGGFRQGAEHVADPVRDVRTDIRQVIESDVLGAALGRREDPQFPARTGRRLVIGAVRVLQRDLPVVLPMADQERHADVRHDAV